MGIVIPFSGTITASSGSGSINTTAANGFGSWKYGGHIDSILVKAATAGTMFNFYMKNANGEILYEKKNQTTKLLDNTIHLPVRGTWTLEIDNSDPDDTFTVEAGFTEGKA